MSSIYTQPLVAARYSTSAGQSIATATTSIIDFGTRNYDTVGAVTTGGSWKFTAPKSGYYRVTISSYYANSTFTAATTVLYTLFKNGTDYSRLALAIIFTTASQSPGGNASDTVYLSKGDYIDVRTSHGEAGPKTLNTNVVNNYIDIEEVTAPTQSVSGGAFIGASYTSTATTSIAHNAAITLCASSNTKLFDTHNAFNTSTGEFTCPESGIYDLSGSASVSGVSTNAVVMLRFIKNGAVVLSTEDDQSGGGSVQGSIQGSAMIECVKGDILRIDIYQANDLSAARTLTGAVGGGSNRWVQFKKIG